MKRPDLMRIIHSAATSRNLVTIDSRTSPITTSWTTPQIISNNDRSSSLNQESPLSSRLSEVPRKNSRCSRRIRTFSASEGEFRASMASNSMAKVAIQILTWCLHKNLIRPQTLISSENRRLKDRKHWSGRKLVACLSGCRARSRSWQKTRWWELELSIKLTYLIKMWWRPNSMRWPSTCAMVIPLCLTLQRRSSAATLLIRPILTGRVRGTASQSTRKNSYWWTIRIGRRISSYRSW